MKEKRLALPGKMSQDELTRDISQIFQSCTFNRSVTSPRDIDLFGQRRRNKRALGNYHSAFLFSTNAPLQRRTSMSGRMASIHQE
jgi:hypothetical protein